MLTATDILRRHRERNPLPEPVTAAKVLAKLPKPVTAGARALRIARLALRASELVKASGTSDGAKKGWESRRGENWTDMEETKKFSARSMAEMGRRNRESAHAFTLSANAFSPRIEQHNFARRGAHRNAADKHFEAEQEALKKGNSELAREHRDMFERHEDIVKRAYRAGIGNSDHAEDSASDIAERLKEHGLTARASEPVKAGAGDIPLSVKCVVLNSVGRVLLLKDNDSEYWDLPGGHLRKGECALAGLEREMREETGLAIGDIQSCSSHELDYGKRKQVTQFFTAGAVSDTVTLSNEHDSFVWADPAELGDYNLGVLLAPARACLPKPALLMASSHQRTPPSFPGREAQDQIRNKARYEYERAVARLVAVAEADALAKRTEDEKKRKKRDAAFLLLAALLLAEAGRRIYRSSAKNLATLAEHAPDETGAALPVGRHAAAPDAEPSADEVEEFVKERGPLLENFPVTLQERLEQAAADAAVGAGHEQEISAAILKAGQEIEAGQGRMVAETESQAVYGHAQLRALKRAGFVTARWVTMGDDRVRESHEECAAAGEVRLGERFPNGLRFPGDAGPIEEVANCRCYLIGGRRT